MNKTLLLGYGNIDRQDDGVAWHILHSLAKKLNREFPDDPSDEIPQDQENPHFFFTLQLTPELAEEVAQYERVCFIDAHTGNIPEDIRLQPLTACFQHSPFTHHLTPETLLSFCESLYHRSPIAILASIRGHEFNFIQGLSLKTQSLAKQATSQILIWLAQTNQG